MNTEALKEFTESAQRLHAAVQRLEALGIVPTRPGKVRVQRCTQVEFDKLPATVRRREFMDWTGYSASELAEEVKAGRIQVYKPRTEAHAKARYYKFEIARLGGWKM